MNASHPFFTLCLDKRCSKCCSRSTYYAEIRMVSTFLIIFRLLAFLYRIVVLALLLLASVQARVRLIDPGPTGLLIATEGDVDRLQEGVHSLPHLQRAVGCAEQSRLALKDHYPLRQKVYEINVMVHHQHSLLR